MNTPQNASTTRRTVATFIALSVIAAALGVLAFRPARASLWPTRAEDWLSQRYGAVGLDEPGR